MSFLTNLKTMLNTNYNVSETENGALGYKSTGKSLLDLNFSVASLRKSSEPEIIELFMKAYFEDRKMALVWLFYVRDVRNGLGERRLFRVIIKYLCEYNHEIPLVGLIKLIPEYGRFDDLLVLLNTKYAVPVMNILQTQLESDLLNQSNGEPISLLAKWLPSINTSSKTTRANGRIIAKKLHMSESTYRKILSSLRCYIDVVECKMSKRLFDEINYATVPSKANIIYKEAFLRNDTKRRQQYLENLAKGETKINASVLYPHEIVHSYGKGNYNSITYDETLEQLWKALPDTVSGGEQTIVVADGSGSMRTPIGDGKCTALSVANALAIYFAERSKGVYKDSYITFSETPQIVDLSKGRSLREKLLIARSHNEVANTNIYNVFRLILDTAVKSKTKQQEIPKNIVIISDMEFDSCTTNVSTPLFTQLQLLFKRYGYQLPRLIFWNVNSRTQTIPIKENDLGVALVSGFSVNIVKMVMSSELDPYQCLINMLNVERYEPIKKALGDFS